MSETECSHALVVLLKRAVPIPSLEVEVVISVILCPCHFSTPPRFVLVCALVILLLVHGQVKLGRKAASITLDGEAVKTAAINGDFVFCVSR